MSGRTHVVHIWGTAISIDVRDELSDLAHVLREVEDWLAFVDETFSTYRPESPVSRVAAGVLAREDAPPIVQSVLAVCDRLCPETDGYFDAWATGRLDPSGVVKGWAIDAASDFLFARGARNHSVNAGGDVRTRGRPAPGRVWTVGIAHPLVQDAICAVLDVHDGAVATSGTAERGLHVLDPHTGRPALDLASVTVVGPDLTTADAYATAGLAMGMAAPDWLSSLAGYEALVVDSGGYLWQTEGIGEVAVPSLR